MTKPDLDFLIDQMREAATLALSYVDGYSREDFLADRKTQQAVMMNVLIIGEVATRILAEYGTYAESRPQIGWWQMRSMRNRIAHGYYAIDYDIVWVTLKSNVKQLLHDLCMGGANSHRK